MKKRLLIPVFTLLLSSVDAQTKIYNSLSKYFKKNKVSELNDYLTKDGGIKISYKTLPNMLIGQSSFDYDLWTFDEYEERYYIFRSYENPNVSKAQVEYIKNNMLYEGKDVYTVKDKNYHGFLQEQDGYEVLMVVVKH